MADYFTRLFPNPADIIAIRQLFFTLEQSYRSDPATAAQARLVAVAYAEFNAEVEAVALRTAELANALIIKHYHQGKGARPPTGAPPHLEQALPTSEPVATPLPAGVVGLVKLDKLDEFPYWKAQEFGSEHNVGKEIRGWFFGTGFKGAFAPDPSMSGQHPLFRPSSTGRTMHIENPIPERRFIRDTVDECHAFWRAEMQAVANHAATDLKAISTTARRAGGLRGLRESNFRRRLGGIIRANRRRIP